MDTFLNSDTVVSVFGSSRCKSGDRDYDDAYRLGRLLAKNGWVVCSGGYGGIMEAVSRGAREHGGRTRAVTCEVYNAELNPFVDEEQSQPTWPERMFGLIECCDALVFLPGGTGTLLELAAAWEMLNKRLTRPRPAVALGGFWRPILEQIRRIETHPENPWEEGRRPVIEAAATPEAAVEWLRARLQPLAGPGPRPEMKVRR
jgi:uncharacterized protein (TIGR00725 family)